MIKFFRKHNNKMLVIFMSLLLVVWLGSTALQAMFTPDQGSVVIGRTRDGEIRQADMNRVNNLEDTLQRVGLYLKAPAGGLSQAGEISNYDWIMLSREAKRAGFATREDEAAAFLTAMGWQTNILHQVANSKSMTLERLYGSVAEFLDVRKAIDRVAQGAMLSEAEIRAQARDQYEQLTAGLVTIKAAAFEDKEATFTDTEIQAHFDKYREQQAGTGLNFGYYLPAKIKIQYCKVAFDTIQTNYKPDEEKLARQARQYWKDNKEAPEFRRPIASPPLPPGLAAETPSYIWEEAKPIALEAVRKQEAERIADGIANDIVQRATDPWLFVEEGKDRFKTLPTGADDPELYSRYAAEAAVEASSDGSVSVATTDWRSATDLAQAPDIGKATLPNAQGAATGIASVAFGVQGLVEIPEESESKDRYLSLHETYPGVLRDADGNRYVFRVVEIQPDHAPDSIDEVKDKVIADLRIARAFEVAKEKGQELAQGAKKFGIEQAWNDATELKERIGSEHGGYNPSAKFARATALVPGLGLVGEDFIDQAFGLGAWSEGHEQWASIPLPDLAAVAVVEWKEVTPLDKSGYANQRQIISRINQLTRQQQIITKWLDPKNIRERNKFEYVR